MLRWRLHRTYESFKPLRNNPEIPAFNRVLEQVRALTFAPKFRRAQPYLTGATRPSMVHTINLQAPRTCRKLVSEEFAPEHRCGSPITKCSAKICASSVSRVINGLRLLAVTSGARGLLQVRADQMLHDLVNRAVLSSCKPLLSSAAQADSSMQNEAAQ